MIQPNANIPFIDVETTGLHAETDFLLEVACIVTDKNLNILDEGGFHAIVKYTPREVSTMRLAASPVVQAMHTKTGLWDKLSQWDADRLELVDLGLREYLGFFGTAGTMPIGGNSVALDQAFINKHLPKSGSFLDYHMRDVSTIAGFAEGWYGQTNFDKKNDHTAMTDIRECIREMKHYRDTVFRPVSGNAVFKLTAESLAEELVEQFPNPGGGFDLVYEDALAACQKALEALR